MRHDPWRWWQKWEEMDKWTKEKALGWWLRDGRRDKGDRSFGEDAHVSSMNYVGVSYRQLCARWDCSSVGNWTWIFESHVLRGGH